MMCRTDRKSLPGGLWHRQDDTIRRDPEEIGLQHTRWINLAQDRDKQHSAADMVMNIQ
jgi:hypothetical protein